MFHLTLVAAEVLLVAVLSYRKPRLAAALLLALTPTYLLRVPIGGIPFTVFELNVWALVIAWLVRHARAMRAVGLPPYRLAMSNANPFAPYLLAIVFWLLVATVAAVFSPNTARALGIWKAYFIEPVLLFAIGVLVFRKHAERFWPVHALGVTVVALGVLTIAQWFTGFGVPAAYAAMDRMTAFFPYPNAVGLFAAPVVVAFITWIMYGWEIHVRDEHAIWKWTVVLLGSTAIALSQTKGALIGVVVGTIVAALLVLQGWRRWTVAGLLLATIGAACVLPATRNLIVSQLTFSSPSGIMRRVVWEESVAMLKDNWITGAGLAGYQTALEPYHEPWRKDVSPYKLEIFLYPHNVILNVWSELGLAGVIVFVWLLGAFFTITWRQRRQPLSVMALAAMVALLVHGLVDVPYFKNDLAVLFWTIMALPLLERRRVHTMHRDPEWFEKIRLGMKTVEARLYDPKRREIEVGDIVICRKRGDSYECLRVEVTELIVKPSFAELLDTVHHHDFGFPGKEYGMVAVRQYYSEEDEREHGVVGIRIRLLP